MLFLLFCFIPFTRNETGYQKHKNNYYEYFKWCSNYENYKKHKILKEYQKRIVFKKFK